MRRFLLLLGATSAALAGCGSNTAPSTEPEAQAATGKAATSIAPAREAVEKADIALTDPETMALAEIDEMLPAGPQCAFAYTAHSPPVVAARAAADRAAMPRGVVKIHGRLVALRAREAGGFQGLVEGPTLFAEGMAVRIRPLGEAGQTDDGGRGREAEMEFQLEQGLRVGYRGTYRCDRPA